MVASPDGMQDLDEAALRLPVHTPQLMHPDTQSLQAPSPAKGSQPPRQQLSYKHL